MRELPVDFEELADAMEDHTGETQYYLDLETGEVDCLTPDILALAYRKDIDLSTLYGAWATSLPANERADNKRVRRDESRGYTGRCAVPPVTAWYF